MTVCVCVWACVSFSGLTRCSQDRIRIHHEWRWTFLQKNVIVANSKQRLREYYMVVLSNHQFLKAVKAVFFSPLMLFWSCHGQHCQVVWTCPRARRCVSVSAGGWASGPHICSAPEISPQLPHHCGSTHGESGTNYIRISGDRFRQLFQYFTSFMGFIKKIT